jgi:HlyD family secretion protein
MQIDLSIDEADVGQIREGMPVRFTVDSYADRPFTGVVHQVRLAATTVNNVVTFPVVVEVANPDGALLPGMTANAEIEVARRNQVLRVPNAALRFKPAGVEAPAAAGGGGGWADDIAKLAPALALSAEQQAALDAVLATMRERARERAAQMARAGAGAGGAPGAGGGPPAGAGGGDWRARAQAMVKASLQPFRDSLTAAQQAQWDTALEQLMTARRVTVWVLRDGKPEAVTLRAGVSDASHTEVVGGELADGAAVIVGEAAA